MCRLCTVYCQHAACYKSEVYRQSIDGLASLFVVWLCLDCFGFISIHTQSTTASCAALLLRGATLGWRGHCKGAAPPTRTAALYMC